MLVGATCSGKTTCYKVLVKAYSESIKLGGDEHPAQFYVLNPKSLTNKQMFGYSDLVSKEWTEGSIILLIYIPLHQIIRHYI
jgi:dynein heavy chain